VPSWRACSRAHMFSWSRAGFAQAWRRHVHSWFARRRLVDLDAVLQEVSSEVVARSLDYDRLICTYRQASVTACSYFRMSSFRTTRPRSSRGSKSGLT
jgi:hypothetical protein